MSSLKHFAKTIINALPGPVAIATWDSIWSLKNRAFRAQRRRQAKLYSRLGRPERLLAGPFAGMRYLQRATGSAYLPKIVGTYELEVLPAIDDVLRRQPDVIVDVGSAEGYYAVGLATRLAQVRIIAYDIYPPARYMLRSLARMNGVLDRIDVRSGCGPASLDTDLAGAARPFVLCDCEGYEDDLLLPTQAPHLSRAIVLVEVHEMFRPGVGQRLKERFAATHDIQELTTFDRTTDQLPQGLGLSHDEASEVMDEHRAAPMQWLYLTPRGHDDHR